MKIKIPTNFTAEDNHRQDEGPPGASGGIIKVEEVKESLGTEFGSCDCPSR